MNQKKIKKDADATEKKNKHMVLGVVLGDNFGNHPATWRKPHVDPKSYTNIDATVKQA